MVVQVEVSLSHGWKTKICCGAAGMCVLSVNKLAQTIHIDHQSGWCCVLCVTCCYSHNLLQPGQARLNSMLVCSCWAIREKVLQQAAQLHVQRTQSLAETTLEAASSCTASASLQQGRRQRESVSRSGHKTASMPALSAATMRSQAGPVDCTFDDRTTGREAPPPRVCYCSPPRPRDTHSQCSSPYPGAQRLPAPSNASCPAPLPPARTCASVTPGRLDMLMDFNISKVSLSTCGAHGAQRHSSNSRWRQHKQHIQDAGSGTCLSCMSRRGLCGAYCPIGSYCCPRLPK